MSFAKRTLLAQGLVVNIRAGDPAPRQWSVQLAFLGPHKTEKIFSPFISITLSEQYPDFGGVAPGLSHL